MKKDYGLSLLRFIAMLMIILCHSLEQANYKIVGNYLAVGVQLFLFLNVDLYCVGPDINSWNAYCVESGGAWKGDISLATYDNVDLSCIIYQVFIKKQNLIDRNDYKIELLDPQGNLIYSQSQDNPNYRRITSFTFEHPVSNAAEIRILDQHRNNVYIENSIYIVTEEGAGLFK